MTDSPVYDKYKEYLLLAGDIITHYATFEAVIDKAIWSLAGLDQRRGACVTAQIVSIGTKFRVLVSLMHEAGAEERLIKQANKLSEKSENVARAKQVRAFRYESSDRKRNLGSFSFLPQIGRWQEAGNGGACAI